MAKRRLEVGEPPSSSAKTAKVKTEDGELEEAQDRTSALPNSSPGRGGIAFPKSNFLQGSGSPAAGASSSLDPRADRLAIPKVAAEILAELGSDPMVKIMQKMENYKLQKALKAKAAQSTSSTNAFQELKNRLLASSLRGGSAATSSANRPFTSSVATASTVNSTEKKGSKKDDSSDEEIGTSDEEIEVEIEVTDTEEDESDAEEEDDTDADTTEDDSDDRFDEEFKQVHEYAPKDMFVQRDNPGVGAKQGGLPEDSTKLFCEENHLLKRLHTPEDGWGCSKCATRLKRGAVMYGCRICEYDLCLECSVYPDLARKYGSTEVPKSTSSKSKDSKRRLVKKRSTSSKSKRMPVKKRSHESKVKREKIDAMSEKAALMIVGQLRQDVRDCTVNDKEKSYAIKFAKLALLEKDGPQARSDYVCKEMKEIFKCDWVCMVGEENGFVGSSSEEPRVRLKLGGNTFLIIKDDRPKDLPMDVRNCTMDEPMKSHALKTIKFSFLTLSDKDEIAAHVRDEMSKKYEGTWQCAIVGADGGSACTGWGPYISCMRGEYKIRLFSTESVDAWDY